MEWNRIHGQVRCNMPFLSHCCALKAMTVAHELIFVRIRISESKFRAKHMQYVPGIIILVKEYHYSLVHKRIQMKKSLYIAVVLVNSAAKVYATYKYP